MSYTFDYSLLCERMAEYRHSQSSLANAIPISRTSINHKLKGKNSFTQWEIKRICELIKDDFISELVQSKVESILENYKRQYASIDIKDLVTITGLSKSTLQNKIVCEPEIVEITRRIGTRVIYLYPQILDAYQKVINRISN